MDPARELAQLLERLRELVAGGRHELLRQRRVGVDAALDHPQLERDGDEPLLCAVVEVALQPPPFGVAGGDDALARGPQLREPILGLGLQPRVVERDRGGGGHRARRARDRPRATRRRPASRARGRRARRAPPHGRHRGRAARRRVRGRPCRSARPAPGTPAPARDRPAPWPAPPPAARRAASRARGSGPRARCARAASAAGPRATRPGP